MILFYDILKERELIGIVFSSKIFLLYSLQSCTQDQEIRVLTVWWNLSDVCHNLNYYWYILNDYSAKVNVCKFWWENNDRLPPSFVAGKDPDAPKIIETSPMGTVKVEDVGIKLDENMPLIKKESPVTINMVKSSVGNDLDLRSWCCCRPGCLLGVCGCHLW